MLHDRHNVSGVLAELAINLARPDVSYGINDDVAHICHLHVLAFHTILPDDAHLRIAEQRKLQVELRRCMPCYARSVDADSQHHGACPADGGEMTLQLPELPATVGSKISHIKHQHHRLLAKIRSKIDLLARIAQQRKWCGWGTLFSSNQGAGW